MTKKQLDSSVSVITKNMFRKTIEKVAPKRDSRLAMQILAHFSNFELEHKFFPLRYAWQCRTRD